MPLVNGDALLSSDSTLSADTSVTYAGVASCFSVSSLSAFAGVTYAGAAALLDVSSVAALGSRILAGHANLSNAVFLTATGLVHHNYFYVGSGGVTVGGTAPITLAYTWESVQSWNDNGVLTFQIEFTWDDGDQPMKWYRVIGCCRFPTAAGSGLPPPDNQPGGCAVIPFQSEDSKCKGALGQNTFIQVIAAHNLSELCNILTAMNWSWPICGISVFSIPADNRFVTPEMTCNQLTDITDQDWCKLPACKALCLQTSGISDMGMAIEGGIIFETCTGNGGVHVGGMADCSIIGGGTTGPGWQQVGRGGVHVGGSSPSLLIVDIGFPTDMGSEVEVQDLSVTFSTVDDNAAPLETETGLVSTNCQDCNLPFLLNMLHNLPLAGVLADFATRNAIIVPTVLSLNYSNRTGAWQDVLHYTGISDDNLGSTEYWRILFEWECTSVIGGQDYGSSFWKLGVSVLRKNLNTGASYDTRILLVFPPGTVCGSGISGFNFEVSFNTQTRQVGTNAPGVNADIILLYDNIGMFSTAQWLLDPVLLFELSQNAVSRGFISQDISKIFPQPSVQQQGNTGGFV